jgi:anti-sigma factor RsiW
MTHEESQDLLLDLAYGELPPARAAEVEDHLAGCAECQREKAALDEARRLTAPVRELEEPPAGFDDRILAAARAQAQLEHGGNLGKVIEVQGNVRPLELSAAQVDAHRAVVRETRRQPRWAMRAVLGGSVAAAAALALVVTTSLQSRREAERVAQLAVADKPFEIRVVAPAPSVVLATAGDAKKEDLAKVPRDDSATGQKGTRPAHAAKKRAPPDTMIDLDEETGAAGANGVAGAARAGGSGGDALGALAAKDAQGASHSAPAGAPRAAAPPPAAPPSPAVAPPPAAVAPPPAAAAPPPVVAAPPAPTAAPPPARAPAREPAPAKASAPMAEAVSRAKAVAVAQPMAAQPVEAPSKKPAAAPAEVEAVAEAKVRTSSAPAAGAVELEKEAQDARHRGAYSLAASLYRRAAYLRGAGSAEGAWNLAHAVECLAAAGYFDEARAMRAELFRLHPNERTAYSAANRALREIDSPGPPADRNPAKAKAVSEPDAIIPADH